MLCWLLEDHPREGVGGEAAAGGRVDAGGFVAEGMATAHLQRRTRVSLWVSLLLLVLVAAGCSTAGRAALPAARPDTVRVVTDYLGTTPRSVRTSVTAPALVGRLYGLLRSPWWPSLPHPMPACPADVGPAYRVTFVQQGRALATVTADAGGCPVISLPDHRELWASGSTGAAFFRVLSHLLNPAAPD